MSRTPSVFAEFADLLARNPSSRELLHYRPSHELQTLAGDLLAKQNAGHLSLEERRLLDELEQFEVFMRLLKAKLRARRKKTA